MKALKDERGQVLILTALALLVLLGFLALAVDVGVLFRAKRNIQLPPIRRRWAPPWIIYTTSP
jgi:Flp pilus assembly protein TadG